MVAVSLKKSFFQTEDGIRDRSPSRGLGDVYKRQALPQGVGKLVQQDDGSMVLANEHEQGFMVNQAIVDFWKSCNGQRKVTDLVEVFAQQTGLQRNQVEKEVMQLLQQLRDGGLIAIAGQPDTPNVEFKK